MTAPTARAALLALGTLMLAAGCGRGEPTPCAAEERRAQAVHVAPMAPAVRDSIVRAFEQRDRVQKVALTQKACRFRAIVRVDSFATQRYAEDQGLALIRALKQHAPNETALLQERQREVLGEGVYDYIVVFDRQGADERADHRNEGRSKTKSDGQKKPWLRVVKDYDATRVQWSP